MLASESYSMADAERLKRELTQKQDELAHLEHDLENASQLGASGQVAELREQCHRKLREIDAIRQMAISFNVHLDADPQIERAHARSEEMRPRDAQPQPPFAAGPSTPQDPEPRTFCPKCGASGPADASFCMKCGADLGSVDQRQASDHGSRAASPLPLTPNQTVGSPPEHRTARAESTEPTLAMPITPQPPPAQPPPAQPAFTGASTSPSGASGTYYTDRRYVAATRSYTTPAVLTLVLYFVFWLPGLIANIVYWRAAVRDEKIVGQAPEGKGCLVALLWVFIILPILLGALIAVIVIAAASGSR
jgi:zinc-ribbon domain